MKRAQFTDAQRERKLWSRSRAIAGCLLLAGLPLLGGCAIWGKPKVDPVAPSPLAAVEPASTPAAPAQPQPAAKAEPSVSRLSDGREGFTIRETGIDGQARADFEQGSSLIRDGKYEKGIELLEKVIAQAPETAAPRINAAIAYRQINKPEQAEAHLKKALEIIPGHPLASNEYGLLLRKGGRFAESRQIYEKSLSAFPEYHPIHRNLGILCDLYMKDAGCAAEHYELYAKAMPKDKQVTKWLADLATRSGKNATALSAPK